MGKSSGTSDHEETEVEAQEEFHAQLEANANASCFVPSFVPHRMEASARMRADAPWCVRGPPSNTLSSEATLFELQKMPVRTPLCEAIDNFGAPHAAVAINDEGSRNHQGQVEKNCSIRTAKFPAFCQMVLPSSCSLLLEP